MSEPTGTPPEAYDMAARAWVGDYAPGADVRNDFQILAANPRLRRLTDAIWERAHSAGVAEGRRQSGADVEQFAKRHDAGMMAEWAVEWLFEAARIARGEGT